MGRQDDNKILNDSVDIETKRILGEGYNIKRTLHKQNSYNKKKGWGIVGPNGDGSINYIYEYEITWNGLNDK